jgi:hypothetical protein
MSGSWYAQFVGTDLIDTVVKAERQENAKHAADNIQSLCGRKSLDFGEQLGRIERHDTNYTSAQSFKDLTHQCQIVTQFGRIST